MFLDDERKKKQIVKWNYYYISLPHGTHDAARETGATIKSKSNIGKCCCCATSSVCYMYVCMYIYTYRTFGNRTPIMASNGFDLKQFVMSFVTSLFNRFVLVVPSAKWHAICCETSSRTASGSGIIDHGLSAEPLNKIDRWKRSDESTKQNKKTIWINQII